MDLIRCFQNFEARRRYSEFESLRTGLTKLYPTLIVPPIPSKQTIGDYAVKQGKAKEDAALISRRKRMLQAFLNRIAKHPILSHEHVFHRFLDGDASWVRSLFTSMAFHTAKASESISRRSCTLRRCLYYPRTFSRHRRTTRLTCPTRRMVRYLTHLQHNRSGIRTNVSSTRKHSLTSLLVTSVARWRRLHGEP